ncbi:MAG TPA: Gfo/Idh/MocA family oxidoreductase [Thermoanaerobaculia bacterium]|nr:Gfo/Idh/MocA family oxidoreductase [Thermoanaerobaculia bacterium]
MAERVRVGVIGTGFLGRLHARVLTEMPEVEVVGFVDPDAAAASEVEKTLGLRRFPDLVSLGREIDAAVVASTTTAHAENACALMEAGCDVLIEKPVTSTVDAAEELIALAAKRGRIVQVGHVERYNPAIRAAIPHIGTPRYVEADRLGVFSGRSLDIDVLLDLMIHDLQLVISLLGEDVVSIHAVGVPVLTSKVDMANVRLELRSGAVANLTASRVSNERVRKFRVFGGEAYVSIDTKEQAVQGYRLGRSESGAPAIIPLEVTVDKKEPLRAELEAFVECVRTREKPIVAGEDGLAALRLAIRVGEKIEESLRGWHDSYVGRS